MDKQDEQETQTEHNDSPANGNGMFYAVLFVVLCAIMILAVIMSMPPGPPPVSLIP